MANQFGKNVLFLQFTILLTTMIFVAQVEGTKLKKSDTTGRGENGDCHYTAAVYEHLSVPSSTPIITKLEAQVIMNINLDIFEEQVKRASSKGAKVIVFPEYGVTGFLLSPTRKSIQPFLEVTPNTTEPSVIPCTQAEYDDRPIQRRISCLAKKYSIIIVVNMVTMQQCNKSDPCCPADDHYQFSTALAFGEDGNILAIYHKTNLYTEELQIFDAGSKSGIADGVFKTAFGTFSLFICFDILFDYPSREFDKFKVDTAIFPTAWKNELPLLSGVEYQQAWALATGMNLLGANQHFPGAQMTGSGVFSASEGAIDYYYDMSTLMGKLVVANVPCFPSKTLQRHATNDDDYLSPKSYKSHSILQPQIEYMNAYVARYNSHTMSQLNGDVHRTKRVLDIMKKINNATCGLNRKEDLERDNETFISLVNDDPYTLKLLTKTQDNFTVTDHEVTCTLSYTLTDTWKEGDWYAFGAFSGLHTVNGQYYVQACVLLRCVGQQKSQCGAETGQAHTRFHDVSIQISGYAAKKTVLAPAILTDGVGLPKRYRTWDANDKFDRIWSRGGKLEEPLLMIGIYGRLYAKD